MPETSQVVVFDIGGVLIRICHTWQEAVSAAGLKTTLPPVPPLALIDFPPFNAFQATEISEAEYLSALAELTGVPADRAIDVHNGILGEPFPGIDAVVQNLKSVGIRTGCLSNTNAPHWTAFHGDPKFSPIAQLDYRAGSHELGFAKPDPRAYQAYIDLFALQDARVIFFDDNADNVRAATAFGWDSHLIDPRADPPAQIAAILADRV